MNKGSGRSWLWLDPRTKILVLFICVLSATTAPSMYYEMLLVLLIAGLGAACGRLRYSLAGALAYMAIYLLTLTALRTTGSLQVMLVAFLGLIHKVYPCGILAGIIISTTKVGEFLSAMNRSHISRRLVIPLAVMLRYLPAIREDWQYIKDAMRMRDISPTLKNILIHPGMTIECLYVPLMMVASRTADELTAAAVTRGIENPKPRTSFIEIGFGAGDVLVTACFLALFLLGQLGKGVFI